MDLSVREAATLMGRSPRTVRAQLARGDLPGTKRNGRWSVPRGEIPLTEAQREALQRKADSVREVVEGVLPSRSAVTYGQRNRSIADLDAFRHGARLLDEISAFSGDTFPPALRKRVTEDLREGLLAFVEAAQQFEQSVKMEALQRSRAYLARVTGALFLEAGMPPREPIQQWIAVLENQVIPAVAGFARWTERLRGRRR